MYLLINPCSHYAPVQHMIWPVMSAVFACPSDTVAAFTATSGEALIRIAECLMDDVLSATAEEGSTTAGPARRPGSTTSSSGSSRRAGAGSAMPGNDGMAASTSADRGSRAPVAAAASSTSSSSQRWFGGGDPAVTLEHRQNWARSAVSSLACVSRRLLVGNQQSGEELAHKQLMQLQKHTWYPILFTVHYGVCLLHDLGSTP